MFHTIILILILIIIISYLKSYKKKLEFLKFLIQDKLITELASIEDGFLAIDESGEKEVLVRFEY